MPATADRAALIQRRLAERYPHPQTMLTWTTPWELLVATILSAQCTDARVNQVTPHLCAAWKNAAEMSNATQAELEAVIRSTGFYRNKAKNILATARRITDHFGGQVPRTMDEMLTLPGVARKTANVVLSNAYGVHAGIAVDTHVKRISFRLGLTVHTTPEKIEQDLMRLFPQTQWGAVNHYLVLFGREVCMARKPACTRCRLVDLCPRCGLEPSTTP